MTGYDFCLEMAGKGGMDVFRRSGIAIARHRVMCRQAGFRRNGVSIGGVPAPIISCGTMSFALQPTAGDLAGAIYLGLRNGDRRLYDPTGNELQPDNLF